jgi:hypothetical protein
MFLGLMALLEPVEQVEALVLMVQVEVLVQEVLVEHQENKVINIEQFLQLVLH